MDPEGTPPGGSAIQAVSYITHIPGFDRLDEALENLERFVMPYVKRVELFRLEITLGSGCTSDTWNRGGSRRITAWRWT